MPFNAAGESKRIPFVKITVPYRTEVPAGQSCSPDDLHLAAEALAARRLLDIDLLDHLIVAGDAYVSLRDRGVRACSRMITFGSWGSCPQS